MFKEGALKPRLNRGGVGDRELSQLILLEF